MASLTRVTDGSIAVDDDLNQLIDAFEGGNSYTVAFHLVCKTGEDFLLDLSEAAGVRKFKVRDSAAATVFSVDSDGNLVAVGTAAITGATTITGAATLQSTLAVTGASTLTGAVTSAGAVKSTSASGGVGYGTGAGTAVTQPTSKATSVNPIPGMSGQITTAADALAAGAEVTFLAQITGLAATDVVVVNHASGGTAGAYIVYVAAVGSAVCTIGIANVSAGSLSEAIVINYAVIRGVAA